MLGSARISLSTGTRNTSLRGDVLSFSELCKRLGMTFINYSVLKDVLEKPFVWEGLILRNAKNHYLVHKNPPFDPAPSRHISVQNFSLNFSKSYLKNTILTSAHRSINHYKITSFANITVFCYVTS